MLESMWPEPHFAGCIAIETIWINVIDVNQSIVTVDSDWS